MPAEADLLPQGLIAAGGAAAALILVVLLAYAVGATILRRLSATTTREGVRATLDAMRRTLAWSLFAVLVVALLAIGGWSAWLITHERDPWAEARSLLTAIPFETWWTLALGIGKVLAATLGALIARRVLRRVIAAVEHAATRWGRIAADPATLHDFFTGLDRTAANALWLFVLLFAGHELRLPEAAVGLLLRGILIYLIVAVGMIVIRATAVIVDTLEGLSRRFAETRSWIGHYEKLGRLVPLFRRCVEYALWVTVIALVIKQLPPVEQLAVWGPRVVSAITAFFLGRVAIELGKLVLHQQLLGSTRLHETERRRRQTIEPLAMTVLSSIGYFVILVVMLGALGFDPMPFLAGAGIFGLVIGLGAQPLIHDVMSGFFILFENTFLVGDFVEIGAAKGRVESIDFRTTRIRDGDGRLHIVRNGDFKEVINYSKDWVNAVCIVGVDYASDLRAVRAALTEAVDLLKAEESDVIGNADVSGLIAFNDSDLTFRVDVPVKPGRHLAMGGCLRMKVKEVFDRRGIAIPFPQRVVHLVGPVGTAMAAGEPVQNAG